MLEFVARGGSGDNDFRVGYTIISIVAWGFLFYFLYKVIEYKIKKK
jgi:hypothetical protein